MKLSDLQAPAWAVYVGGVRYSMRPLSLAVFAEAEMCDVTLSRLSDPQDTKSWVELFAFLNGLDPKDEELLQTQILPALLTDPLGFELYRNKVATSFSGEQATQDAGAGASPNKKSPRKVQKFKPAVSDTSGPEKAVQEKQESVDYAFLIDVARTSSIPIRDLMQMTFYGVTQVSKSLEKLPPMQGLMGGLMG